MAMELSDFSGTPTALTRAFNAGTTNGDKFDPEKLAGHTKVYVTKNDGLTNAADNAYVAAYAAARLAEKGAPEEITAEIDQLATAYETLAGSLGSLAAEGVAPATEALSTSHAKA